LNESILQYVAETSGGVYYNAASEDELRGIYGEIEPRLSIKKEEIEITSIFAGIGMLLFLIGGAVSILWFGRVP
jgi:Ca-activated chloride channel family protein